MVRDKYRSHAGKDNAPTRNTSTITNKSQIIVILYGNSCTCDYFLVEAAVSLNLKYCLFTVRVETPSFNGN